MVGQSVGKYRILRQLSESSVGPVFEGLREDIGVRAAIKILRPEFAQHEETATRFFNEARMVNIIKHPAIVRIFDYGRLDNGTAYLAMEFLEGETLRSRLRGRRLSEADSIRLGRQIASGLAAAHAKQIVHRDLKPDNVFVVVDAEAPGGERTKILDFGVAKSAVDKRGPTQRDAQLGTPIYMAPEQYLGAGSVSERADVYSLGVIMFEMLSGQPPFLSKKISELMSMHLDAPPPPLQNLVPGLDQRLQSLIENMLSKKPEQRPAMADVAQQLKHLGNISSDVLSPEALAAMAKQGNDFQPELPLIAPVVRVNVLAAPTRVRASEAQTQIIPSRATVLSGWKPLVLGESGRIAEQSPSSPERSTPPTTQRPWLIPILCLMAAALLCLLVLLSE